MTTSALLAFAAAALGCAGLGMLVPQATGRRREPGGGGRLGASLIGFLARAGAGPVRGSRARAPQDLEARVVAAGRPLGLGVRELMAAKLAGAALGVAAGALLGAAAPGRLGFVLTAAGPVGGFLGPDLWLRRRRLERFRAVRRQLPAMLDLLRVTVRAGQSPGAALAAVGGRATGPLAEQWLAAGRQVELGVPLYQALGEMVRRLPLPEVEALVGALDRARRHGAPISETLAAQARDARLARRRRIQEEAAKAGPKIQLVVALLLVPSVLLLVAAALVEALLTRGGGLPGL